MMLVDLTFDGRVATITLRNPTGNRINFQMRDDMLNAVNRVAESGAHVLLVKGDGGDFCLGGDVRDWLGVPSAELRPRIEVYAQALDLLGSLPIPTVAVVQGGCMGGGFELALACDLIVAEASARFCFPEATVGIVTLQGGVYQLAARVGWAKALELVMLSTPVSASQMAAWNVVNTVVDDGALKSAADELAQRLAAGPGKAYAATKTLLGIWKDQGPAAARNILYDISMPLFDSSETQEAMRAAAHHMSENA